MIPITMKLDYVLEEGGPLKDHRRSTIEGLAEEDYTEKRTLLLAEFGHIMV